MNFKSQRDIFASREKTRNSFWNQHSAPFFARRVDGTTGPSSETNGKQNSLEGSWHMPAVTWKAHKCCGWPGFLPNFFQAGPFWTQESCNYGRAAGTFQKKKSGLNLRPKHYSSSNNMLRSCSGISFRSFSRNKKVGVTQLYIWHYVVWLSCGWMVKLPASWFHCQMEAFIKVKCKSGDGVGSSRSFEESRTCDIDDSVLLRAEISSMVSSLLAACVLAPFQMSRTELSLPDHAGWHLEPEQPHPGGLVGLESMLPAKNCCHFCYCVHLGVIVVYLNYHSQLNRL